MHKLLCAYFTRLKKDKALWLFAAGMFLMSAAVMLSGLRLHMKYPDDAAFAALEYYLFQSMPFIGVFASVTVGFFLGKEYGYGTLRNKLVTGHTRGRIYLASLAAAVAAAEIVAVGWLLGGLTGIPYFGLWTMETEQFLLFLLLTVLATAALAALFHLIGMLVSSQSVSVVAAMFASLGLLMLGSFLYNQLCEPETTYDHIVITAQGLQLGDEVPNPAYVGGALRSVYYVLLNILPTGQGILMANADDGAVVLNPALGAAGSVLIILGAAALGLLLFRKKDLK